MEQTRRGIDLHLLGWIKETAGLPNVPYDIKKIKRLENRTSNWAFDPYRENIPAWLEPREGDYSLIGEMVNLQSLSFHEVKIQDFSFLNSCQKLRKLDVSKTNFADCNLLLHLPNLTYVHLPKRNSLNNTEVLEQIKAKVETNEPFYRDEDFPSFTPIAKDVSLPMGTPQCVQHVEISYHREADGTRPPTVSFGITDGASGILDIAKLAQDIQNGRVSSICLSLNPYGEDPFMTGDFAGGWAALAYCDTGNDTFYQCYNPKYASVEELAPPQIGGQTPVPKPLALDDLHLAAACVAHFIATGQLYPGSQWVKAE